MQKNTNLREVLLNLRGNRPDEGGAADRSGARATQGHRDRTVARIKIWTKGGGKVVFRKGVDGEAMVCHIIKGDSTSLIV